MGGASIAALEEGGRAGIALGAQQLQQKPELKLGPKLLQFCSGK
jgi:hypothetical protein